MTSRPSSPVRWHHSDGVDHLHVQTKSSAVAETPRDVHVIEYFVKSLKIIRNDTLEKGVSRYQFRQGLIMSGRTDLFM